MNQEPKCRDCGSSETIKVSTYKRYWHFCKSCGGAWSEERSKYPLSFLGINDLKKQSHINEENIYDYFTNEVHVDWAKKEGIDFVEDYIKASGLDVKGKEILDISGGNGHVMKEVEKLGARISATEYNKKTVEYIRDVHGYDVWEYDINNDNLFNVIGNKFDIVLARACIMFSKNLQDFAWQLSSVLKTGGYLMVNHSVKPTIGVILRTQLDEFSYYNLRQSEYVISIFKKSGFVLQWIDETPDTSEYVYDHDLLKHWRYTYLFYENKAVNTLANNRLFAWAARDRRRSTMLFKKVD